MITRHVGDAFTHTVGQADYKLVSRTAGIDGLFHRAYTLNRLVQESDAGIQLLIVAALTMIGTSRSAGIRIGLLGRRTTN